MTANKQNPAEDPSQAEWGTIAEAVFRAVAALNLVKLKLRPVAVFGQFLQSHA